MSLPLEFVPHCQHIADPYLPLTWNQIVILYISAWLLSKPNWWPDSMFPSSCSSFQTPVPFRYPSSLFFHYQECLDRKCSKVISSSTVRYVIVWDSPDWSQAIKGTCTWLYWPLYSKFILCTNSSKTHIKPKVLLLYKDKISKEQDQRYLWFTSLVLLEPVKKLNLTVEASGNIKRRKSHMN